MTDTRLQHNHTMAFLDSFESLKRIKDAVVMDSGCGDGFAAHIFTTLGAKLVLAYDPVLSYNPEYEHQHIKWYDSLKYINRICNICWSHHVIEHIDNPVEYLRQLKNHVASSGEVWLSCPNTEHDAAFSLGHIHNFTIGNLVACFGKAGYGIRGIKWLVTPGQLRVRVPVCGSDDWPDPFILKLKNSQHFNVHELPREWRWKQ